MRGNRRLSDCVQEEHDFAKDLTALINNDTFPLVAVTPLSPLFNNAAPALTGYGSMDDSFLVLGA